MSCGIWKKRISDAQDGSLSGKRAVRLERHLEECVSCRAYRDDLDRLGKGAKGLADPGLAPGEWEDFGRRLGSRLAVASASREAGGRRDDERGEARAMAHPPVFWAWARAGVGFLLLAFVVAYFAVLRPRRAQEPVSISFEDSVAQVIGEIGPDPELERSFNREIVVSINEAAGDHSETSAIRFDDNPLLWEGMSEEDLRFIESELRKEQGHGGPT